MPHGRLGQQTSVAPSSGGRRSRSKGLADLVAGEGSSWLADSLLLSVPSNGQGGGKEKEEGKGRAGWRERLFSSYKGHQSYQLRDPFYDLT